MAIIMTLSAYFVMVYFLKKNVGCGECSIQGGKNRVTVTVLGTQRMLIPFVTWALMAEDMSGGCVQSYRAII
jgi:hypothetical protein